MKPNLCIFLFVLCANVLKCTTDTLYFEPKTATHDSDRSRSHSKLNRLLKLLKKEVNFESEEKRCGYKTCNLGKSDMINVHLVPHTHDDVGWLKTVDQYYYGAKNNIQHAAVQYILDTVVQNLESDPAKRFIYVEVAFFYRWWNEQSDSKRHAVKRLVNQGRLEFILGGWCMNDEASTHYNAIIDQHTVGFRFLQRNFGDCARPKIGWQIDPFGHSREQASLFAQFGFDGLFFGRLDYQDKNTRLKDNTMELMWQGSQNLGEAAFLLTGVDFNGYNAPTNFCFDRGCDDPPIMDDPDLEDYNVDERVKSFIKAAQDQASDYTTNHIMMTMGSDFQYENAIENYSNLDKLIKYVNAEQAKGSKINLLYSTPSCYLYALNQANQSYTSKSDDFFPYASRAHTFWTGYFTSRPAIKGYVRTTNNFLQVCKQLDVLTQLGPEYGSDLKLDVLRQAMGVAQHHDAVSGTEKQLVAFDYAKRLAHGISECQDVVSYAFSQLLPQNSTTGFVPHQNFCQLLNASYCPITEDNVKFAVIAYNPVGRTVQHWFRLPVTGKKYIVLDAKKSTVSAQVVPVSKETQMIPDHKGSKATGELVFQASVPALGFTTLFVSKTSDRSTKGSEGSHFPDIESYKKDIVIKNKYLSLSFSALTGLLKSVRTPASGPVFLQQNLLYYKAFVGNNSEADFQASGAYIFRPNGSKPIPVSGQNRVQISVVQGSQVQEVHQVFSDWASQVTRIYNNTKYAEIEWTVGPIPVRDGIGKEIISKFTSDLASNSVYYTDSNGREMLKRVRNYRPTWKMNQTEPISGNYYPVNSRIYIQDEKRDLQLTILTDRSQGGASIYDGELELMVHRRTLVDDNFGVGEALNETGITGKGLVVRGKHYILLDTVKASATLHRDLGERLFMAPSLSYSQLNETPLSYAKKYHTEWSGLERELPSNVHLLTLEEWEANSFLLRLEHFYERNEDPVLSKPATVQLKGLFKPFKIKSVEELTLGANQKLSEATRLEWNVKGQGRTHGKMSKFFAPVDPSKLEVILKPMQIRTFQVFL